MQGRCHRSPVQSLPWTPSLDLRAPRRAVRERSGGATPYIVLLSSRSRCNIRRKQATTFLTIFFMAACAERSPLRGLVAKETGSFILQNDLN